MMDSPIGATGGAMVTKCRDVKDAGGDGILGGFAIASRALLKKRKYTTPNDLIYTGRQLAGHCAGISYYGECYSTVAESGH